MSIEVCDPKHWTYDEDGPFMPTEMTCSACAEAEMETLRSLLRKALGKNGPRAHTLDCDPEHPCWMCRSRALLGIEEA